MTSKPSGEYYDWKITGKPELPWLLPYHQTVVMKLFLAARNTTDTDVDKVYLTFADTLDVIRRLDNITLGVPKLIYLVGWQKFGHDSDYPSLDTVCEKLKRPEDKSALDSLRRLIREARKHHTIVSLHINLFDAYETSPLWDDYVANDIVAKDTQGNVIFGEVHDGHRSSQLSYTREWELGLVQKRIDGLLEMIPELIEGKSIHIDAFHACRPRERDKPISPLLGYGMDQETATIRKIYRYWRDQGLDVTSEGSGFLRPDAFVGLQPMSWWDHPDGLPPELYCGSPMHAEEEVKADANALPYLLDQFCLMAAPWYYRNNASAVKGSQTVLDPDTGPKRHPNGLLSEETIGKYGDHVFIPALWHEQTVVAYSRTGYEQRTWNLPPDWQGVQQVVMSAITQQGLDPAGLIPVHDRRITLTLKPREAFAISPE